MGRLALLVGWMVVAGAAAAAATTYRWVDADGVTHYSDQPHQGADKIRLVQPQTYSAPSTPAPAATAAAVPLNPPGNSRMADRGFHYDTCSISQPAADEVLFDPAVTVHGQLAPSVRTGDKVVLVFDGAYMEAPSPGQLEFHIEPVERGAHTVALQVRDATGRAVCQSTPVTFNMRLPSELAPLNPNNPARKH
jgi:hypothetical protein